MKFPPLLKNNRAKNSLRKPSLPFDRCGRFGADIVDDAVDAGNFVDDTRRDSGEDVVRESAPFGGHEVDCRDGAHDDRVRLAQTVERLLRHGVKTIQSYYQRR